MDLNQVADTLENMLINNRMISMQQNLDYMYAKVTNIFRYEGLPLTIPPHTLESFVMENGSAVIYTYEDNIYATQTPPGTKPNLYGESTELQITHKVGKVEERITRTIGVDAVWVKNDTRCVGLNPLLTEYSIMKAQTKITMMRNLVDLRGNYIIQAKDENAYRSALEFENAIRRGDTAVILAEEFDGMEGLVVHNTPLSNNPATQTIELTQFIEAMYYSELGINLNNNMKSQYVSDSEIQKSTGMPLIYNMLACRQEAVRDINALFDMDITVSLSSEWDDELDKEQNDEQEMATEDGEFEETDPGAGADEENEEEDNEETEESTEEVTESVPELEPLEPVTKEELIEATELLTGEDHEQTEDDQDTGDSDTGTDISEDETERGGVETEEEDDEEGER